MWGCSKDNSSCDAFNVAVSAQIDSAVKCECTFGEKGVPYGNKDFPQIPTTTTTTTTKTMTTVKTTMTTLKGPMLITGKPMATTAEANRSGFGIFWTLLVAIGTIKLDDIN
ncbi:hypothetical protein GPALN_006062 [Globodera pallida]|nr:hypothetical protein GPALN_006062 [Globodera pallida]